MRLHSHPARAGLFAAVCLSLCGLLMASGAWAAPVASSAKPRAKKLAPPKTTAEASALLARLPSGESAMPLAPMVRLDGKGVVPSQYKLFRHTGKSVQRIVAKINYRSNFVVLVGGGRGEGVFVQVGIIGPDSYATKAAKLPNKIVYGRKWRIEKLLPTSELIQTVFLAIRNAEEHEIREQFVVSGTTPFNGHMDLPLMAAHQLSRGRPSAAQEPRIESEAHLEDAVKDVRMGGYKPRVVELITRRSGGVVFDVVLEPDPLRRQSSLLAGKTLTVVAESATRSGVLRALMGAMLHVVQREVDERFTYDGFARFSHDLPVNELVRFARDHRKPERFDFHPDFKASADALNRAIDATRPARLAPGPATERVRETIGRYEADGRLAGVKPALE